MKPAFLSLAFVLAVFTLSVAQDYKSYDEGIAKFKAQDYEAVVDLFTRVLDDPDHHKKLNQDLHFYRGQSYYHINKPDDGIRDLKEALALNHFNKPVIYWYIARCNAAKNKHPEAENNYAEAIKLAETNKKVLSQILADRAAYYSQRGMKEEAQNDLAQARSLDPNAAAPPPAATLTTTTAPSNAPRENDKNKNTQIIVKAAPATAVAASQNQKADQKEKVSSMTDPQNSSAALVSSIADLYKDEKRYALVIGNSNYPKELGMLKNPVNDATDVASELRQSNFEVQLLINATYIQIREAMRKFQEKLVNGPKDQTVGLFYYAGHGVQYQDENYLVPIDANVKFEDDIVRMCFPVQRMVLSNMEKSNSRMNIIILDACRNNPFPATTRGVASQGLGEMKRARGSFIAYATAPGSVASDGTGRNGLYTQELLKALRKPGLTIEQVFKDVRMNVLRLSDERQYTWDSSNIIGEFFFKF
jgi:tetratricopeptide (TPR) repeat protein